MTVLHERLKAANAQVPMESGMRFSWDLPRCTCPDALRVGLVPLGITGNIVRNRTSAAALKLALTQVIPYRLPPPTLNKIRFHLGSEFAPPFYRLIRARQNKSNNGYSVLLERRRKDGGKTEAIEIAAARVGPEEKVTDLAPGVPDRCPVCGSRIVKGSWAPCCREGIKYGLDNNCVIDLPEVQESYDLFRSTLGAEEVGEMLTRILEGLPAAVRLGNRKGQWHVPERSVALMCDVANVVEGANRDPNVPSIVVTEPCVLTDSTLMSVRKGIIEMVGDRCDEMMSEVKDIGQTAATHRVIELASLRCKIDTYVDTLGDLSTALIDKVQDAERALATASAISMDELNLDI